MRLADFIVIGAPKAGTTTLYEYLARHPGVFMTDPKEPEFFAKPDRLALGMDWYAGLFANARPDQKAGEASTAYANYPKVPGVAPRIAQAMPHVRLIYLLREPVSRTYSFYAQEIKNRQRAGEFPDGPPSFEERAAQTRYYVDSSDYQLQIEQYLAHFPREQLLVEVFEEFVADPAAALRRVLEFIGVDPAVDLMAQGEVATNTAAEHVERYTRNVLAQRMRSWPLVGGARRLVPNAVRRATLEALRRTPLGKRAERVVRTPPMKPETRRELTAYFAAKRPALEALLGRSLSIWDKPRRA